MSEKLELPDGYVVVCVHCAKELKIAFDEPNDLEAKMAKYEKVLQSIANELVELSHDKIKWQCEDHIRWAKEALSSSGNNAEDVSNTKETLPKGKELSDEEIETIMYKYDWSYDPVSFARAIIKASRGEE
jgi:hypothetical protein